MMPNVSIMSKAAGSRALALRSIFRKIGTSVNEKFTEIEIKVPWGKVAGKLWNPKASKQPILALHGWQENAGSFDRLLPHLPEEISVLAIDLPGHGYSSWLPEGGLYSRFMNIQTVHRIREHFGWEKIGLLGHSWGGMHSFTYSVLFPKDVKFVVALDYFKYPVLSVSVQSARSASELSRFLELEKSKTAPPSFTEEEAIRKLIESTEGSLDESACRILMKRGYTKKSDGSVFNNRDPRVKFLFLSATFTNEHIRQEAQLIRSPYMVLKGEDWHYNDTENVYFESLEALKKNSVDLRFFKVPGKHHFHLTNPETVAELVTPFLQKYN